MKMRIVGLRVVVPCLAYSLGWLVVASTAQEPKPGKGPLEPEEARQTIQVDPGLRVELVAAEPQITSPVAMAFDEQGRLWVVEMRDYPNGPAPGNPPEGRLKILEDGDGDGFFEQSRVFADELLFANGVLPWKDGAIVTAAPHIVWLLDTDGDGTADVREILYEGFAVENPQLRVSHPTLGIDGWIAVANGLRGGQVRRAGEDDAEPIDLSGRDFRFDLVNDRAEPIAGMGQYGLTFDDWGRRFVCTNRNHLVPIILEDRYAQRNPDLPAPGRASDDQTAGGAAEVFPLVEQFTTSSLHIGSFSAACGVTVYRGNLLPEAYQGSVFTCEPTGSLVHQEVLTPDGAAFSWAPARKGVEFFASTDHWCRPVAMAHGPDGALYVVDMYRAVIEHPQWMPPELRERPDLLDGKDHGRIWRIVPESRGDRPESPKLGEASTAELVGLLDHPDGWWRTTAQRLLLQRQDPEAIDPLREMARAAKSAEGRAQAAWLLEHAGELDEETLLGFLCDDHPRLREQGTLLAEHRLLEDGKLRDAVIALADDEDARVRFQAALALGFVDDDVILDPLATIARLGANDRWTRAAVGSAVPGRAGALLLTLLEEPHGLTDQTDEGRLILLQELAALVGTQRDPAECAEVLEALWQIDQDAERWRLAGLNGLTEGLARRGTRLGSFLEQLPEAIADRTAEALAGFGETAEDADADPAARRDAIRLLAQAPWDVAGDSLSRLLVEEPDQGLRIAAAQALAARTEPEVADRLLHPWRSLTPAVRREVAQGMVARADRAGALLDAMEQGLLAPRDLDANQSRRLRDHPTPEVRDRARSLLASSLPAERVAVLERYQEAIEMPADPHRGREVFRRLCITCHRLEDQGVVVGPDIGDTRTRTKAALLSDILNPNEAIDANYVSYTVATVDGQVLGGLIASETASALTLLRAEGQSETILKQEIEEIRSDGVSLMPEGIEQDLTVQEMADLLDYLKNWRYMDGVVPLTGQE
ncbi:PVC-type heme-binding CxxCH protein [Tautonia rosea]|uniref:PVC-type heme-binding CxxCH protein n=1 Tax=Tautonia rosea TaxID=2728037 RepID=UPI0014733E85|nr:PVC-type heme-binding CxxCH protein [Tautonia rosea]